MGEEIRARLRRNAREPYVWLLTGMALVVITLNCTGHEYMGVGVLVLQAVTLAVDRWTTPVGRNRQ